MLRDCNISKVCKQQMLLLMHDLQNIVRALKISQHNKQREVLCKLRGTGLGLGMGKRNGESLEGKKEVPNLSALEDADDWEI